MTFTFFFLALANFVTPCLLAKGQIHYSQLPHGRFSHDFNIMCFDFSGHPINLFL